MFIRVDFDGDGYTEIDTYKLKNINDYDAVIISDYNKGFISEEVIKKICDSHKCVFLDTTPFPHLLHFVRHEKLMFPQLCDEHMYFN